MTETATKQNSMKVMGPDGDTKIMWDPDKRDEVKAAEDQFNALLRKGYLAYKVTAEGKKGEVIRKFDKDAEAIILAPQMRGG